jgi:hypothetical protein
MPAAAPTGQPSGSYSINTSFNTTIPATTTGVGGVISSYAVPVNTSLTQSYTYFGAGTGATANTINKVIEIYYFGVTGVQSAIDLSAQPCTDGTLGIHYVRELFIFNDALPANPTYILSYKLDGTTPFIAPFVTGGTLTSATVDIQAGTVFHAGNPYSTTGWDVSTNKNMVFTFGANTFNARIVIVGSY